MGELTKAQASALAEIKVGRLWEVDPVVNDRAILTRVRSAIAKALDQPAPPPPHNPKARQR